ncbi:3-phytase B [Wickerhamiella sorbophila]|uniref:3-phytase B n=1 Tax=Wickerhamiella sorbophila TaxID=45607 RepID=A0A2T0FHQ5_9ASCO|nr:3-phytase B [Wickerhamiella sorbophila]PRT54533.1 3-phytase B [Wickerhamiella sorbophila]
MKFDLLATIALASVMGVDAAQEPFYSNPKPYSQDFTDNYNFLKYTTWMGPWSQRRGVGINRDPPKGCKVDQVAMMHRHAERYPASYAAKNMDKALQKFDDVKGKLKDDLEFLNYWVPFVHADDGIIGQESMYGAYSGWLDAYHRGALYRTRYGHLWDGQSTVPMFTSGFERVAQTARKFGQGFFGFNYTDVVALNIYPETAEQGANTLTAVCNIPNNATACEVPTEDAKTEWPEDPPWVYPEFEQAAKRLNKANKGLNLTAEDIPQLMSIAPFELNVRGSSPWVGAFTAEEWAAFEYLHSAFYYCYAGPEAPSSLALGSNYLNATRVLFNQGPQDSMPMIWSFAHDTDITPVVTLLGFANDEKFDPTKVSYGSRWDVTDIVPEGAHLVFERLVCEDDEDDELASLASEYPSSFNASSVNATYATNATYPGASNPNKGKNENIYVRIVLNEAVVPLPACNSGPGKSCKLSDFSEFVDGAIKDVDFVKTCNVSDSAPHTMTMFWDYNTTNSLDYNSYPIPYQAGLLDSDGQPSDDKSDY